MMRRIVRRKRIVIGLAVALALLVAFEVGVRMVTPDAVHYDIVVYNYGVSQPPTTATFTTTGTYTTPAIVAKWRAAMTAHPDEGFWSAFLWSLSGPHCNALEDSSATVWFTWHGLPVEIASPGPDCGAAMQVWSGGLPDPYLHDVDYIGLLQDSIRDRGAGSG